MGWQKTRRENDQGEHPLRSVVSYGGGVNSTAMIIEMANRAFYPDAILFADTGNEFEETYEYIQLFNYWLKSHSMPEITIVRNSSDGRTLYDECIDNETLPSKAFGFSGCSVKWKRQPMDRFVKSQKWAQDEWNAGRRIVRFIGIHAGEKNRGQIPDDELFTYVYPLREWDCDQDDCIKIIDDAGLPIPRKSACYFCPSSRKSEIKWLAENRPDLFSKCVEMEKNAEHNLTSVRGLGRSFSWGDFVEGKSNKPEMPLTPCTECYDGECPGQLYLFKKEDYGN